jgi:hypothetical protein
LRFGRGIDWNVYFYRYTNLAYKTTGDYEFLFELICNIEGALNIPYPIFIMINEFAFIVGIFFIISRFKQYSTYILPFVLSYTLFNENFIRWSMAIVFIFGGVYCLLSNKIIKSYLFVLLGFLTHSGSIIIVPFFVLFKILKDRQLTPIVSTLLLVVTTFVLSLATGKYVKVCDADDSFCSNELEKYVDCLSKTNADMVISNYSVINDLGKKMNCIDFSFPSNRTDNIQGILTSVEFKKIQMHAIAYKRSIL